MNNVAPFLPKICRTTLILKRLCSLLTFKLFKLSVTSGELQWWDNSRGLFLDSERKTEFNIIGRERGDLVRVPSVRRFQLRE